MEKSPAQLFAEAALENLKYEYERSLVPGRPTSRSASAHPLRRLEQLQHLLDKAYPANLSPMVIRELRAEDMRDYASILKEVRGYVRAQVQRTCDDMAERKAWDMDHLLYLHWQAWPALWKLSAAAHVPRWIGGWLVGSARGDFENLTPLRES